jgi:membrane protein
VRGALLSIIGHLSPALPPGTERLLLLFLTRSGSHTWEWVSLGFGGTLLAGTQMMRLMIDGFTMVYGEPRKVRFWNYNLRALSLLITTIVPLLVTADLIVFGRQIRNWMLHVTLEPGLIAALWAILYAAVTLLMAMIVLSVIYRVGRPAVGSWVAVLPGAALATLLWWLVSVALGFYVRHVPYGAIYQGTADIIVMMIWMQLTATVILFGAAFNAESASAS